MHFPNFDYEQIRVRSRPRMRRSIYRNRLVPDGTRGPFLPFTGGSRCCGRSPHCGHSPRARSKRLPEFTHCGQRNRSVRANGCPLLETPYERWNILGSNDLNMRYGCMRRNRHELVIMQEGLEHVLQINAKIMVQYIAETPIFN